MSNLLQQIDKEKELFQISDLMDIKYGFGLPERDRIKGTIPVYASSGIVGYHNESKVKNPSIIIGRKGNVGSLAFSHTESYPIDTVFYVDQPKEGFDLKYLYYLLQRINLQRYGGDSAVPGLSRDAMYSLSVQAPKIGTQKKIAEILSAYDAKIEINNSIIKNLETMAQAIFSEWFVNFKFPGHKKIKMVEGEIGEIPEEWDIKSINDFCKTFGGGTPNTKEPSYWQGGDIPWATPTDMTSLTSIFIDGTAKKISQDGLSNSSAKLLPPGTILMTSRATVGILAISKISITTNQGFIASVCETLPESIYFFWWLKSNISIVKGLATGSTFPEISRGVFREIKLLVPKAELLIAFEKVVSPFHEQIYLLHKENIYLKSQRNQLLAKLI